MTEKDMEDVLQVREALDELAVNIACEKITEEQLENLRQAMKDFEASTKSGDVKRIAQADVLFHDIIYQSTGNSKLVSMLNNLREQIYRYRVEYLKDADSYPNLMKEHEEIEHALAKRDKKKATTAMQVHVDNQAEAVKKMIREQE